MVISLAETSSDGYFSPIMFVRFKTEPMESYIQPDKYCQTNGSEYKRN